jgi:hypothetical protein
MNAKQKAVLDRIEHLEDAIAKGRGYLNTGANAGWHGFRPLFEVKVKRGAHSPPHPDWVRNVFLPRRERALEQAKRALERLNRLKD